VQCISKAGVEIGLSLCKSAQSGVQEHGCTYVAKAWYQPALGGYLVSG
jgi:hypothetical protein